MSADKCRQPTSAQTRALKRMAGGDELWTVSGRTSSVFWHGRITDRAPSFATLHAMRQRGWIETRERDFKGGKYCITAAGREAIAESASVQTKGE